MNTVGYDDHEGVTSSFLVADLSVACAGEPYRRLTTMAALLVLLWPIGVPVLIAVLLSLCHGASRDHASSVAHDSNGAAASGVELASATRFLWAEYRPAVRWWEVLEMGRKLTLAGFVQLVPQRLALLRLLIALLLSISHLVLLQFAHPYVTRSTAYFAVSTSFTLVCSLIGALVLKTDGSQPYVSLAEDSLGFRSSVGLGILLAVVNVAVLAAGLGLLLHQLWEERRRCSGRRLRRWHDGSEVATPILGSTVSYHLFLSHVWGTGQDVMRVTKTLLVELLPGLRCFLDVCAAASNP